MLVDSGAADHVIPGSEIPMVPIVDGECSKAGVHYTTADGGRIPNLGEQTLQLVTKTGQRVHTVFQVADVTRPILSVARLAEVGHQVRFHKNGGGIIHKQTGKEIVFERHRGVYVLEATVEFPMDSSRSREPGFARQAA